MSFTETKKWLFIVTLLSQHPRWPSTKQQSLLISILVDLNLHSAKLRAIIIICAHLIFLAIF
jgi:hypothetical protein